MAEHTPGPWSIHSGYLIRAEHPGADVAVPIAELRTPFRAGLPAEDSPTEEAANARLIAAAPDLLSACEFAASRLRDYVRMFPGDKMSRRLADECDSAIRLARDDSTQEAARRSAKESPAQSSLWATSKSETARPPSSSSSATGGLLTIPATMDECREAGRYLLREVTIEVRLLTTAEKPEVDR